MGTYFFMDDNRMVHERQVLTYVQFLANIGGFTSFLVAIIGFMLIKINYLNIMI